MLATVLHARQGKSNAYSKALTRQPARVRPIFSALELAKWRCYFAKGAKYIVKMRCRGDAYHCVPRSIKHYQMCRNEAFIIAELYRDDGSAVVPAVERFIIDHQSTSAYFIERRSPQGHRKMPSSFHRLSRRSYHESYAALTRPFVTACRPAFYRSLLLENVIMRDEYLKYRHGERDAGMSYFLEALA